MRAYTVASLACLVASTACIDSKISPEVVGAGGACEVTNDCEFPLACVNGICTDVCVCTPDVKRCNGSTLEACSGDCLGFTVLKSCSHGCADGACAKLCHAGERQCTDDKLVQCNALGVAFDFVETCAHGCSATANACNVCAPSARRCEGRTLERCSDDGQGEEILKACEFGCGSANAADGGAACSVGCLPNTRRCDGLDVVECDADGQATSIVETCAGTCIDEGVCAD